jgi:hypothetical protein
VAGDVTREQSHQVGLWHRGPVCCPGRGVRGYRSITRRHA